MALMTLNETYSVGVDAIDDRHAGLFEILNDLDAAMMKGEAQTLTGPLLKKLAECLRVQFVAEEAMMAETKYPGVAEHRAGHAELVRQVEGYIGRIDGGEVRLNSHLLNFLREWLTNDIQKTGREYGAWLNGHGVR
jgi:hemerythrin-like metal-binding protein